MILGTQARKTGNVTASLAKAEGKSEKKKSKAFVAFHEMHWTQSKKHIKSKMNLKIRENVFEFYVTHCKNIELSCLKQIT